MTAIELAAAWVTIVPSLRGAEKQITAQLGGVDTSAVGSKIGAQLSSNIGRGLDMQAVGAKLSSVGDKLQDVGGKLTNSITKPALTATGVVGGLVGALGFKRLVGIDTARGQFKGLGHDADAVMAQVDRGVTNTALSMAEGASLAVGILATGNMPLEQLESQLKRVANVSAAYNVDSAQAGYLLNNVLTKNKVTYGDLSQMVQNGIPIISDLAKHYGVAGDEIQGMCERGEISIEDFNAVLDNSAGKAAEEYAGTWKGITANILANLGKIGAKMMGPSFDILKQKAADLLGFLQSADIAAWAERTGAAIGGIITLVVDGNFSGHLREAFGWEEDSPIVGMLLRVRDGVVGLFDIIVNGNFSSHLREAFGWEEDSPIVGFLQMVHDNLGKIVTVALAAGPAISIIGGIASGIGTVVSVGGKFTSFMAAGSSGAKLLGGALRFLMGPWGLLIAGIVAAVASSPELQSILGELAATVGGVLMQVLQAVMPIFQELAELVLPLVSQAVGLLAGLLAEIVPVIGLVLEAVAPLIAQLLDALLPIFRQIIAAAQPIIDALMPLLADAFRIVGDVVRTVFEALGPIIEGALSIVSGIIQVITSAIQGDWSGVWEGIKQIFSGIWDTIVAVVTGAIDIVKSLIIGAVQLVKSIWTATWTAVSDFFSKIWTGIKAAAMLYVEGVKTVFTNVVNFVRGIPGQVISFFTGLGSKLLESGRSLIQGFLDGIMAGFQKAKQWVSDGLAGIRKLFPFSPAKEGPFSGRGWVLYSGLSLGETFTSAIADSLHDGRADIADEMDGIEDEFSRIEDFANGAQFSVRTAVPDTSAGGGGNVYQTFQTDGYDEDALARKSRREAANALAAKGVR